MGHELRPDLRSVTVCAVDSLNPRLAARALKISSSHCSFGDVVLFTHEDIETEARIVRTPHITSHKQYSDFVLKEVIQHIHTPWVLLIQWDGYVVDPSAWRAEFFDYDYIGARWPWCEDGMSVGNGGFSLRSAKLMRLIASDAFPLRERIHEDEFIGRICRPILEAEHGIRFAPDEVADRFSYEHTQPGGPTFGFHSPHNLFRHISDSELRELLQLAHPSTISADSMIALFGNYLAGGKFAAAQILYSRMRGTVSADYIRGKLIGLNAPRDFAQYWVLLCETAFGRKNIQR
ncbi:hypothetical protein AWB75_01872 [Caballeronia catudaia]|uniref:DUF5672 domain-containing protein n=1 Tax=Caballeronia catudaia TaxID=1777136 RepID=A0A158A7K0_9BURK|nr:DUF5672 family protein [Caballeronia catudaia]SAK53814.1 hypothetical protein AWB75_01872 [Caballeronia catudaia]